MEGEKRKAGDCSSSDSGKRSRVVSDAGSKSSAAKVIQKISALEYKLKSGVQGDKTIGQALHAANVAPAVVEKGPEDIPKRISPLVKKSVMKSKAMLGGPSRVGPLSSKMSFKKKKILKQLASEETFGRAAISAEREIPANLNLTAAPSESVPPATSSDEEYEDSDPIEDLGINSNLQDNVLQLNATVAQMTKVLTQFMQQTNTNSVQAPQVHCVPVASPSLEGFGTLPQSLLNAATMPPPPPPPVVSETNNAEGSTVPPITFASSVVPLNSGESNVLSHTAVAFSSGRLPGDLLPEKIRTKIWEDQYIDFYDLLYPDYDSVSSASTQGVCPSLNPLPRKKRDVSRLEWSQAFDLYQACYLQKFQGVDEKLYLKTSQEMLAYSRLIKKFQQEGIDWKYYDKTFRREREISKEGFGSLRLDLHASAFTRSHQSDKYPSEWSGAGFQREKFRYSDKEGASSSSSFVPRGFCFAFHKRETRCRRPQCSFSHQCWHCNFAHPAYLSHMCRQRSQSQDYAPSGSNYRRNSREFNQDGRFTPYSHQNERRFSYSNQNRRPSRPSQKLSR